MVKKTRINASQCVISYEKNLLQLLELLYSLMEQKKSYSIQDLPVSIIVNEREEHIHFTNELPTHDQRFLEKNYQIKN